MTLRARLSLLLRRASRTQKAFAILLILYAAWDLVGPSSAFLIGIPLFLVGAWLAIRLANYLLKKAIWRLRNRFRTNSTTSIRRAG